MNLSISLSSWANLASDQKFSATSGSIEAQFKAATVGLLSAADYARTRADLEQQRDLQLAGAKDEQKRKLKQEVVKKKAVLSFDVDEEAEAGAAEAVPKRSKLSKDPEIDTSFLPDKDRDEKEVRERIELMQEWKAAQERIKNEKIEVTYSFWDGSGHRRTVEVKKGTTIEQFLEMSRRQMCDEFSELRTMSADHLIYVKEDLIIPHHYSFYDFILTKARGKSGPLFHFDVRADVRLLQDIRVEKEDSHAGKIITRSFYDKHKHIFPYSRYEIYDPKKEYSRYTIHGAEVAGK